MRRTRESAPPFAPDFTPESGPRPLACRRGQLELYVDRLHEETAAWTKSHPLTKDKGEGPDEAEEP